MTIPTMTMPVMGGEKTPETDHVAGYDVNETFIKQAVDKAEANILRMALFQTTKDKVLEHMSVSKKPIRGGVLFDYVLSEADESVVRAKTIEYLLKGPQCPTEVPTREQAYQMMDLFSDKPMSEKLGEPSFNYEEAYEELALEDYPRDVTWSGPRPPQHKLAEWKVLVVGAGISGLAAAILLKRLEIPFKVVERQAGIGGTWLLNSYPGARVDTMSYLFQYKFEKNYPWTEYFACAAETRKYLEFIAHKHGVANNIAFNCEVISAVWDDCAQLYYVTTKSKDGVVEEHQYNVIISASGLFSTPNSLPDIQGLKDFEGPIFHTANWDHNITIKGKRIAQIGTGSTGAQLAPCLAHDASHLSVFQRTPNWMFKIEGYRNAVTPHMKWLCDHMPGYWNWFCWVTYYRSLHLASLQIRDDAWESQGGKINKRNDALRASLMKYMESQIGDRPDLMAKMTPDYAPLVRRLVVDNGFFEILKKDNVDLITNGIHHITPTGIVSNDGLERQYDIIVLGAGFKTSQYLWPVNYVGRNGMTLDKAWKVDGARSYLGMTMPSYPNLFTLYGPNHQPRGGSLYSYGETWARYAVEAIVGLIERDASSMEVKTGIFNEYQTRLDEQTKKLLWESAGSSYYVNEHGRQAVNMPWTTAEYHPMISRVNFGDFHLSYKKGPSGCRSHHCCNGCNGRSGW